MTQSNFQLTKPIHSINKTLQDGQESIHDPVLEFIQSRVLMLVWALRSRVRNLRSTTNEDVSRLLHERQGNSTRRG